MERTKALTGNEDRPTGKMLFESTRDFDDIVLEEVPEDDTEEGKAAGEDVAETEEVKDGSDEDEEFVYDRALYDADALEELEDIDFDEDD